MIELSSRDRLLFAAGWIAAIGFALGAWAAFGWTVKELIAR